MDHPAPLRVALDVVEAEVRQDERLDDFRQKHGCGPQPRTDSLEEERVSVDDLQEPVRARDEPRKPESKDVVGGELLDHLGALHHAQLRQHRQRLHEDAGRPEHAEGQRVVRRRVRHQRGEQAGGRHDKPGERVLFRLVGVLERAGELVDDPEGGREGEAVLNSFFL